MLYALRRSQQIFKAYSQQFTPQIDKSKKKNKKKVLSILRDLRFWRDIALTARILKPIHKIQYLSETDNYSLYRVIDNWILIKQSLMKSATEHNTKSCQLSYIVNTLWNDRYLKQMTKLYVVTSLLIPEKHAIKSIEQTSKYAFNPIITRFFRQYASPDQITTCIQNFWAFRAQIHAFFSHPDFVWNYISNSVTFWDIAAKFSLTLDTLTSRLMQISDNSVPGERAWSIINLILIKSRNDLKNVNIDRLLFIYINKRILNKSNNPDKKKLSYTHDVLASNEELAELEDLLL